MRRVGRRHKGGVYRCAGGLHRLCSHWWPRATWGRVVDPGAGTSSLTRPRAASSKRAGLPRKQTRPVCTTAISSQVENHKSPRLGALRFTISSSVDSRFDLPPAADGSSSKSSFARMRPASKATPEIEKEVIKGQFAVFVSSFHSSICSPLLDLPTAAAGRTRSALCLRFWATSGRRVATW